MKKFILMSLVASGALLASADSYLYWMVDQSTTASTHWEYTSAALTASKSESLSSGQAAEGFIDYVLAKDGKTAPVWSSLAGYTDGSWTFYVELLNSSDQTIHTAKLGTYANLAEYIKTSVGDGLTTSPIVANTFAVPEPTSGMMMLLGLGLLALRRKKA